MKMVNGKDAAALGLAGLVGLSAVVLFWVLPWKQARDRSAPFQIMAAIRSGVRGPEGFWTADLSGLHAQGRISREIAEADARPLSPLTAKPRPYRGWLVVAMDSGASLATGDDDTPDALKGEKHHRENFGFCVYPADPSLEDHQPWIIGRLGTYRKTTLGNGAVLQWPSRREIQQKWARVD